MENKAFIICSSVATSASKCRRSLCYFSLLNRAERKPGHKTSLSMCVWRRKALSLTKHPPRLWLTAPQVKGTAAVVQTFLPAGLSCSAGALVPHRPRGWWHWVKLQSHSIHADGRCCFLGTSLPFTTSRRFQNCQCTASACNTDGKCS